MATRTGWAPLGAPPVTRLLRTGATAVLYQFIALLTLAFLSGCWHLIHEGSVAHVYGVPPGGLGCSWGWQRFTPRMLSASGGNPTSFSSTPSSSSLLPHTIPSKSLILNPSGRRAARGLRRAAAGGAGGAAAADPTLGFAGALVRVGPVRRGGSGQLLTSPPAEDCPR